MCEYLAACTHTAALATLQSRVGYSCWPWRATVHPLWIAFFTCPQASERCQAKARTGKQLEKDTVFILSLFFQGFHSPRSRAIPPIQQPLSRGSTGPFSGLEAIRAPHGCWPLGLHYLSPLHPTNPVDPCVDSLFLKSLQLICPVLRLLFSCDTDTNLSACFNCWASLS